MKKLFLTISLASLLLMVCIPFVAGAQNEPLVPCGNPGQNPCGILDFFTMLARIYRFIVYYIATPLAIIAFSVAGIFILISAGNPNLMTKGKEILKWAAIGLVLVWGSWLIIDFVLGAIGFTGNWSTI